MNDKRSEKNKLTLPKGTTLTLDGEEYVLESGTLEWDREYLYAVGDPPEKPTQIVDSVTIEVETWTTGVHDAE